MRQGCFGFRIICGGDELPQGHSARKKVNVNRVLVLCGTIACAAVLCLLSPALQALELDAGAPDPRIAAALKDVSADHIRSNIEKLVGFQTRLTLSAQDPD